MEAAEQPADLEQLGSAGGGRIEHLAGWPRVTRGAGGTTVVRQDRDEAASARPAGPGHRKARLDEKIEKGGLEGERERRRRAEQEETTFRRVHAIGGRGRNRRHQLFDPLGRRRQTELEEGAGPERSRCLQGLHFFPLSIPGPSAGRDGGLPPSSRRRRCPFPPRRSHGRAKRHRRYSSGANGKTFEISRLPPS